MKITEPTHSPILVVDDDHDFRRILAFSLKRKYHHVLEASNGQEAFHLLQSQPISVVLSDVRMPNGSGIELLEQMRNHGLPTPIILFVTDFTDISIQDAHRKGAEAVFSKSFDRTALDETIKRLISSKDLRSSSPNPTDTNSKVQISAQNLPEPFRTEALNLGKAGMFVVFPFEHCPQLNDTVSFQITFNKTKQAMSGKGVVRWARVKESEDAPLGCGIEFTQSEKLEIC